jgi:hypothetical protein
LVCNFISNATHNRAGEILYKRIAPTSTVINGITVPIYNYSFQINTYTEINSPGGNADRCKLTLYLGNGDSIIMPRVNGLPFTGSGDCAGTRNGVDVNGTTPTRHRINT